MCIIGNVKKMKGADFMQKRTENTSATTVIRESYNIIKDVNKKVLSAILGAVMLISAFGIITRYYTVGYSVYYGDVNVGVTANKEEAIEAYTEAATDVKECNRGELENNLRFVMTIASVDDMLYTDIYRGIVEAAEGKEDCYSIAVDGNVVACLKTEDEAEGAIEEYLAIFERDDATIYSDYTIENTKEIVTEIVTVEEAAELIEDSGLFTVVYKDVFEEEYDIPYNTTVIEDESLPEGIEIYTQKGEIGKGYKKAVVFYENGEKKHSVDPVTKILKAPVDEIVRVGTGKMVGLVKKTLPWPTKGTFTSPFGPRWGRNHNGVDVAAKPGTPIYAPAMGKVTFSSTKNGYGNYIMIDHGNGYVTTYAHMTERKVQEGAVVKQGDLIGTVGSTGRVTGPHLHFEILLNGKYVDPMDYIAG